ncbi:MAG: ribosome silencing factor [Chloroflexi bacterium]|nr:ribosome silencing factor [Chloroflexota bacterium]
MVNSLEEKKGENIILLDLQGIASFTDYFVICTGTSDRMLDALADVVRRDVRKTHKKKGRLEGVSRDGWLLVDYGDIVVHLFSPDQRDYYRLEELWQEGKTLLHIQ